MQQSSAPPSPSVIISVWGRFHGFDLARELDERGALAQLVTSYPGFATGRFGIRRAKVTSRPAGEAIARLGHRLPRIGEFLGTNWVGRDLYERAALKALRSLEGNVFIGWSGTSLSPLRAARARGMVTIVERGSAHIVEQTSILRDEYDRWGLEFTSTPQDVIDKELREIEAADYISVPSQFVVDSFVKHGVARERLLLNPYGASLADFKPGQKQDANFRVIQVGHVSIQKGFATVIEAFERAAIPQSELLFVGSVSDTAKEYVARRDLRGVVMKGAVPQSALPTLYASADVACLGSVQEGLAMVLLQAAASGLPIVCSENSGGRDVIGDSGCGIVVPVGGVEEMADAFRALYEDPERRRLMGIAARQRAESQFGWHHYGNRAYHLYSEVLAERGCQGN